MKLSEMNTQEMAACLCKIAEPIEMLGKSEKVNELLKVYSEKAKKEQEGTLFEKATQLIGTLIPAFLCAESLPHTVRILSALTGKREAEIMAQKGMQTVKDIMDCLDEDMIRFFTSSVDTERRM